MPEWGLTLDMRLARPWKLPAGALAPGKTITDPVHGDVYLNVLEQAIVDSPPFQRLRRVRQLGTTHLVYPGATHTRFAHSLGALRVAQDLLDVALNQRDTRHGRPDLFEEWRQDLGINLNAGGSTSSSRRTYIRKVGEAIVVTRLGALLHDLCHVAYGHSVEDDLLILDPHDENSTRFSHLWTQIEEQKVSGEAGAEYRVGDLIKGELARNLRPLILSKERKVLKQSGLRYPFSQDLVGNTICADLIDYLQRDHLFTGLPISLGHRYMSGFYVTPANERQLFPSRMALNIHRRGKERADIVSELLKHLRYRYELQERVIVHHAKLAADAMIGKMLELLRDALWSDSASALLDPPEFENRDDQYFIETDVPELRRRVAEINRSLPISIDNWVKDRLENLFLESGDDGLLEYLSHISEGAQRGRRDAISRLAVDLLDRNLFKFGARIKRAKAAHELYDKFHSPEVRHKLEREAAEYAELGEGWKVVLWVPKPEMRLKQAEVLVDHGDGISKLVDYSSRGREIYEDHKKLWSISVFVGGDVTDEERRWVLARLAQLMLVHWEGFEHEFGDDPQRAPEHLAALLACRDDTVQQNVDALLAYAQQHPARKAATGPSLAEYYEILSQEREQRSD
jgi:HD superfamily phosphohydrolase